MAETGGAPSLRTSSPPPPPPSGPRLAVVHDTDGPRIRLGVTWFAAAVASAAFAVPLFAVLLGVAAGLAADQVVQLRAAGGAVPEPSTEAGRRRRLRRLLADPRRLPAALGAASLPLAAAAGTDVLAGALLAIPLAVLVFRLADPGAAPLAEAALAIAASVAFGLAAAGPVLLARLGPAAAVVLVVLVSVWDAGDYLVGSGAKRVWEGPLAGIAAVAVFAFAASVVPVEPLDAGAALVLGGTCVFLAPFGPPTASLLMGDGGLPARCVRRLDSLLVVGPIAPWILAVYLAR